MQKNRCVLYSALPTPSQLFPCASQVLVQGCLLDPSQREAFLQQVYEQLCLFEDKVATMLQQQYEPQSQVSGKESGQKPFRESIRTEGKEEPWPTREGRAKGRVSHGWSASEQEDRLPARHSQLTDSCWEKGCLFVLPFLSFFLLLQSWIWK